MTPGGREVTGPRVPENLHPALLVAKHPCCSIDRFDLQIWSRRLELQSGVPHARRPPRVASMRKEMLRHGPAKSPIARGEEHHLQNPTPARHHLLDASGRAPYSSYAIYSRDSMFPHPPAAGAADGGRGTRRDAGGEVDLRGVEKSPIYCSG